jgi:CRP/FNR family transcriptional regulator, cyclic AMP receptor protein
MSRISVVPPKPSSSESLKTRGVEFVPTTPRERADALESTPWSLRLSWSDEQGIGHYLKSYRLVTGTALFREGDHDAFVAIVIDGALEIRKEDRDAQPHVVARLGRGKMVGEMSLIDGAPRSATAIAAEPTEILVMSKEDFERMCVAKPDLALKYTLMIAEAIAQLLRQTTGRMVDFLE